MKVFLSSPYQGLEAEREAIAARLSGSFEVVGMEDFGSSGLPPLDTCIEALAECHACILLLGGRYGSRIPGLDVSYTEAEYENSRETGKQVFAYIHEDFDGEVDRAPQGDADRDAQRGLKKLVLSEVTVDQNFFTDPDQLADRVARDVERWSKGKQRPRFRRKKSPIKDELAYATGRTRRAVGMLYPLPIVLVDLAAIQLERYPPSGAGRMQRKVNEIHWELHKKGAQILIFNDLPVIDQTGDTVLEKRLRTVEASEALVVCFVRKDSDLERLALFESAGSERALVYADWIAEDDAEAFPASYRLRFTGDELSQCAVALRTGDYLQEKISDFASRKVLA